MKLCVPLQLGLLRRDVAKAAPEIRREPESDGVVPSASVELPLEFDPLAGRPADGLE